MAKKHPVAAAAAASTAPASTPASVASQAASQAAPVSTPAAPVAAAPAAGPKKIHVHYLTRVEGHGNIQKDLDVLAPKLSGLPDKELELKLSMLVRAYDPCISCSTHCIDARGLDTGAQSIVKINRKK